MLIAKCVHCSGCMAFFYGKLMVFITGDCSIMRMDAIVISFDREIKVIYERRCTGHILHAPLPSMSALVLLLPPLQNWIHRISPCLDALSLPSPLSKPFIPLNNKRLEGPFYLPPSSNNQAGPMTPSRSFFWSLDLGEGTYSAYDRLGHL